MSTKLKNSIEEVVENDSSEHEDAIAELVDLVPQYEVHKNGFDALKKMVDAESALIKSIMLRENLNEFSVAGIKVSCSVSKREDFIEEALLQKIKELGLKGIIKKKEYVDMDSLESAIYDGKIDAAELIPCQTVKEVVTLRIKRSRKDG